MNPITKIPSGVQGFDEISMGGIPKGRTTLVSGTSGSGKTVFASQFLYKGIMDNKENGVFVTFEETPDDIKRNMSGFGWDVSKLEKQKKWAFVDASPEISHENVEVGHYDFMAFLIRIEHAVKKVKAKRIAIDSISALFPRYKDTGKIRRELLNIGARLKQIGVTTILTAERPVEGGEIARFGVEEFVSDNVILLHNRLTNKGDRERTVEILKFRGSEHETNEAILLFNHNGMSVFPRPKPLLEGKGFTKKISTGITGVDKMLYGGVYKNSTTLLTGSSGTGKTISALQFVLEGARRNEKCLFIEFEESPEQLYRNAESFGWKLRQYVKQGKVNLICHYPEDLRAEQYLKIIQELVLTTKAKRVAVDSLSALERIYDPQKFREFVVGLNAFLKMQNVTSYLTNTTSELLGLSKITATHLSTATDNIIVLKYVELGGFMTRMLTVLKARGSDHVKQLAEYHMTKHGVEVLRYFEGVQGLMSGSAIYTKPPVDALDIMTKVDSLRHKLLAKKITKKQYDTQVAVIKRGVEEIQSRGL